MTEKIGCVQHDCAECVAREQRPWVGLTDEETVEAAWPLLTVKGLSNYKEYARAIEAKLKEKNT